MATAVARRAGRPARLAAMVVCLACGLGCGGGPAARLGPDLGRWADGPVRWLIRPAEGRQFRRLRSNREAIIFIEAFWRRRDPDPGEPGNPFLESFEQRVAAADSLYAEGDTRGSLTDRGRALILLGAPPILRSGQRTAVTWNPVRSGTRVGGRTAKVRVEEWEYTPASLSPALLALLGPEERARGLSLTFVVGATHTYLVSSEKAFDLAAEAAIRRR